MHIMGLIQKLNKMQKHIITIIACITLFAACKKNELGGKSTIKGTVAHHDKLIANATVYIKFNTQDSPGSDLSKYDAHVKADASGNYEFTSVYKGEYYLYAVGEDFAVPPPYQVFGGIPVKTKRNETLTINVPVTEGD
jgi:hypothetical protein